MRLIKKILLFSGIALCFVVLLLSGIGLYLYYHPDQIKPTIERSLSASTGASCTIENLSYSFKPMFLEAKGILLKPLKPKKTFSVEIRSIRADLVPVQVVFFQLPAFFVGQYGSSSYRPLFLSRH